MSRKIALVTGASRGIGEGIAARLVEDGHFVCGTATTQQGADAIAASLGDKGMGLVLRVEDETSISDAMARLKELGDAPTILVNNAGITRDNLLLRMQDDEWRSVIDTNLNGLFRVTKACLRGMIKARWGRIVNVGSVVSRMGNPGQSNYVASKSAIEGFSRSLAMEVASRNITVNTVAPGFIATDMTDDLTDDQSAAMLARIPLGRTGSVSEVAGVVAFLVTEEASYITAQTIHVNGGLYAA